MEEKRYTIYYKTDDKEYLFKENVTREQVRIFLENLTPTQKSSLRITQIKTLDLEK